MFDTKVIVATAPESHYVLDETDHIRWIFGVWT
jgi:hypothetical protein